MYPGSKYSTTRPPSPPTFANFSPPLDYPSSHHHHHQTMAMKQHHHHMMLKGASSSATLGRNDIIFGEDVDSIEFCDSSSSGNGVNAIGGCPGDSFTTERRRRGHSSRRNNHKFDVEQQVKWTRKNIAATMERFEPSNTKTDYMAPQTPINHVYSYAYYEPGAAKCHTNIPSTTTQKDISVTLSSSSAASATTTTTLLTSTPPPPLPPPTSSSISLPGPSKSPPRNSIRALLAKSFRSKTLSRPSTASGTSSSSCDERHTYTTHYGTQENLYEEVNEQKIRKVLSDNRIVSGNSSAIKEEFRRVQHNHFRVLDELNLSLEALIMPPTPPDVSPTEEEKASQTSQTTLHVSMENLSNTVNSIELKDHTCINPEFDEGDLDSGFSGSASSSGASYNDSLRYYKTTTGAVIQTTTLPHLRNHNNNCRSSITSKHSCVTNSDDNSSFSNILTRSITSSPFNFSRRCSDSQRSTASTSGTKPKRSFWMIKQ